MLPFFFFFDGFGSEAATTPVAGRGKRRTSRYFAEINGKRIYGDRQELEALIVSLREQDEPQPVLKREPAQKSKEPPAPVVVEVRKNVPPVDLSVLEGLVAEYFAAVGTQRPTSYDDDEEEALTLLFA